MGIQPGAALAAPASCCRAPQGGGLGLLQAAQHYPTLAPASRCRALQGSGLGLLQAAHGGVVDVLAQALAQQAAAVHQVEAESHEDQACRARGTTSGPDVAAHQATLPAADIAAPWAPSAAAAASDTLGDARQHAGAHCPRAGGGVQRTPTLTQTLSARAPCSVRKMEKDHLLTEKMP